MLYRVGQAERSASNVETTDTADLLVFHQLCNLYLVCYLRESVIQRRRGRKSVEASSVVSPLRISVDKSRPTRENERERHRLPDGPPMRKLFYINSAVRTISRRVLICICLPECCGAHIGAAVEMTLREPRCCADYVSSEGTLFYNAVFDIFKRCVNATLEKGVHSNGHFWRKHN